MSRLAEIISLIQRSRTFLLSVHKNPDGDALGSQLALMLALEKAGKTVTAQNLDPVPETYRFLPSSDRIKTGSTIDDKYDAVIVLDCEPARTGLFDDRLPTSALVNIDHHVTNPLPWQLTWLESNASATGEMVHELIRMMGVTVDRDIALCLFTSIFTDTGSFRYANTTARCMHIAADMIEAGADPWLVTENVYESFAYRRLKLLGTVLADIRRTWDERVAWVVITEELFRAHNASAEDTDNFINFVRSTKGVEVAVLIRETSQAEYKISLRSKGRVDLTSIAQHFGGGGHKNAAGAVIAGSLQEVQERVINEVIKAVSEQIGPGEQRADGRRS